MNSTANDLDDLADLASRYAYQAEVRSRLHAAHGPDVDHAAAAELALSVDAQWSDGHHIFESQMLAHAILALVYELRKANTT